MTPASHPECEAAIVSAQLGREPRPPWRVHARCRYGYPTVIVSPSRLEDGTPFPTWAWLTCPFVATKVAAAESAGGTSAWAARSRADAGLARALRSADDALRAARSAESSGGDACGEVGLAGQRDPLGVKCLHAHVALSLAGIADPIGDAVLAEVGVECDDERCSGLLRDATEGAHDRG